MVGVLLVALGFVKASATTWDEPWQKAVVSEADAFVRVKLTEVTPDRVGFTVMKQLAGKKVAENAALTGFHQIKFGSMSVKEDVFQFETQAEQYLLIKPTEKPGEYTIATPTSGFAPSLHGMTKATYRHSYHQAFVSDEVYEMSMIVLFDVLHGQKPDLTAAKKFIDEQLALAPADIPKSMKSEEFARFCNQHVALELLYYLGGGTLTQLEPFLRHKNPHGQISAVRALGRLPQEQSKKQLVDFIASEDRDGFAKVMAVWALREMGAKDQAPKLEELLKTTKDDEAGFGGNIMDPRVATKFPESVHASIRELLAEWNGVPK